jgi:quercetin 2,3-dioxygenase
MSGPVTSLDDPVAEAGPGHEPPPTPDAVEITASRATEVGGVPVRRALPRRQRRTIGAWCFADHFGPVGPADEAAMRVGPHPHIGLQTVTWLVAGEALHTDSLGSEQLIRPGELNLMTSGRGVSHAELSPTADPAGLHGAQLWVALPESTRRGAAAFAHHADLPVVELGPFAFTVLLGSVAGESSPGRTDTPLVGAALAADRGDTVVPVDPDFEHGLLVLDGSLRVGDDVVGPGSLAYLGDGRDELALAAAAPVRALLLGGVPLDEELLMWWNFVARSREELDEAWRDWESGDPRFGEVRSSLDRIGAPHPPWAPGS